MLSHWKSFLAGAIGALCVALLIVISLAIWHGEQAYRYIAAAIAQQAQQQAVQRPPGK